MENLMIEVVIRKNASAPKIDKYRDIIHSFRTAELSEKVVLDFPLDWEGFKDGTMSEMLNYFDTSMYVALAYFARESEVVTDLTGEPVESYDVVIEGKVVYKFVKKKLRILKIINYDNNEFEVNAFVLDLRGMPPIRKILNVYSGSEESGLRPTHFIGGNRK